MPSRVEIVNNYPGFDIQEQPVENIVLKFLSDEALSAREITVVFVEDNFLRTLHHDYLGDDTFTDVMTFNLSEDETVEGEIYISLDRAKIHAAEFGVTLPEEIARLVIHGLLHLKGYDDRTNDEQNMMRKKEELYLKRYVDQIYSLKVSCR